MNNGRIVLRNGTHKVHVEAYKCPRCNRLELVADVNGPYYCEECAAENGHAVDMKSIAWIDVPGGVWSNRQEYAWDVVDGFFSDQKRIVFAMLSDDKGEA